MERKLKLKPLKEQLDFSKKEDATEFKTLKEGDNTWEATQMQGQSSTSLEADEGYGAPAIIRVFEFATNPEAFRTHRPTEQELFNAHLKGIEIMLWKDGLKIMTEVSPKIRFSKDKSHYRIFVGARPSKGNILYQTPQTLSEIVHGTK